MFRSDTTLTNDDNLSLQNTLGEEYPQVNFNV